MEAGEWIYFINLYKASSLSRREFCSLHKLNFETFKWWLYRNYKSVIERADPKISTPLANFPVVDFSFPDALINVNDFSNIILVLSPIKLNSSIINLLAHIDCLIASQSTIFVFTSTAKKTIIILSKINSSFTISKVSYYKPFKCFKFPKFTGGFLSISHQQFRWLLDGISIFQKSAFNS